jgi:hypothetical protein
MRSTRDIGQTGPGSTAAPAVTGAMARLPLRLAAGAFLSFIACGAQAHEWYTDLRAPDGTVCCNGHDCAPVDVCYLGGVEGVVVRGKCMIAPQARVLPQSSPDGREHACYWGGEVRCVIRGAGT